MSTLRQSLRQVLAHTLRRGASWLDRLAVRVTPVTPDADDSPAGGPPAHWQQRVHRPPPAGWLARIRQQAPHLLDGAAPAGTGWTRISVAPPAVPLLGVPPIADEAVPRPLPNDRPPPAAAEQSVATKSARRATPLFAGRALHLRRADSPPSIGLGASSSAALPKSSPGRLVPAGSPTTALPASPTFLPAGTPNTGVQQPVREPANRRAAPTAAVAPGTAATNLPESPNPHGAPPAESPASRSPRAGPADFSPAPAAGHLVNATLDSHPAPGDGAVPANAAGSNPARFAPESHNWPSPTPPPNQGTARPTKTSDLEAPGVKPAGKTHETPDWTPATPWPAWSSVHPAGALGPGASERPDATPRGRAATAQPDHGAALPWPALPDWPDGAEPESNPHHGTRQHLDRLDREQRGLLWNESPF